MKVPVLLRLLLADEEGPCRIGFRTVFGTQELQAKGDSDSCPFNSALEYSVCSRQLCIQEALGSGSFVGNERGNERFPCFPRRFLGS